MKSFYALFVAMLCMCTLLLTQNPTNGVAKNTYVFHAEKLYKNGHAYTGVYKKKLYKKGALDRESLYLYDQQLFKNGRTYIVRTLYKKTLYINSKKATGKHVYKKKLYIDGKQATGIVVSGNKLYKGGVLYKGYILYKERLYYNGKVYVKWKKYGNSLYKDGKVYDKSGTFIYKNELFINGVIPKGYWVYNPTNDPENFEAEVLYYNGKIAQGTVKYEGMTYVHGKIKLK